jgi:DNA-binding NarL/FixJ family response regulator
MVLSDRVPVWIEARDPISRAGLLAQLRNRSEVQVVDQDELKPGEGLVILILADEVDADALRAVKSAKQGQSAKVVLVVGRLDDAGVLLAVEAGAGSLLRRADASVEAIVEAVRSVAHGAGVMPPDLLGRLLEQVGQLQRNVLAPRGLTFSGLTDREVSVLRLVAEGHDGAEIGRMLCYSERTVKSIIHDVTTRLGLRNRTHAVAYALRQGLI